MCAHIRINNFSDPALHLPVVQRWFKLLLHLFAAEQGYTFDSGPSLFSGMSINPSPNPLKHVLNAIGEDVEWLTYDTWGVFIPEGSFPSTIGPGPFADTLKKFGAPGAQEQVGAY
jgi:phytoene dehydrogenase-like protein